ncbi:Cholinesterase [Colletotrichum tanaceti]|uniref:Carboxylic ester hydrolase n=1 Tax=Colletotrichum tanaceti TaxID=1306861 RepID=A0A4U6X6D9_9PEZI|nr:Cholinesterase [Colletotrichum tanaceti]TKW51020.1 Cholinesterase [Colletotrichum tanaceti]
MRPVVTLASASSLACWALTGGLAAVLVASPPAAGRCGSSGFLTVQTSNGPITGHPAASNGSGVLEYLGIPYVRPPVGDLRFAPPERFTGNTSYEASSFGFDCPLSPSRRVDYPDMTPQAQLIVGYFASGAGTPQSEDCLTLNIWTRREGEAQKPVIVFFYGGRFAIGNTNSPFYNGKYFAAAQDVVVVTVNYRLSVFGFPGFPGGPQNLGLRDQRAAVEWVRDNIAGFGGDPARITIAGQSSGGVAVDYWAYAYAGDPIVNGLVAPSGNAFSFPLNGPSVPERNWESVVAAVNCTGADAARVMACMRAQRWEAIKAAAAAVRPTSSSSVLRAIPPFYPRVDNEIVFDDYVSLTESGSFAKLPILLGNNDNEDGYYRIPAYGNGVVPTPEQVASFLLESFTCPNAYQAEARRTRGVPAWVYRYFGDWDNTRLFPTSGAYHGVDLHMVFGASEDVSGGIAASAPQRRTTALVQRAWAAFAGDPVDGLRSVLGWPRFDPREESLVLLAVDNRPEARFVRPRVYDAPCSTVTMGALATPAPA